MSNLDDIIQGGIEVAEKIRPIVALMPFGAPIVIGINIGEAIASFISPDHHAEVEKRILGMIKAGFKGDVEAEFRSYFPRG